MAQPYKLIYGVDEILEGLSNQKLFNLEKANYSDKKINWSYPFEFNITAPATTGPANGPLPTSSNPITNL